MLKGAVYVIQLLVHVRKQFITGAYSGCVREAQTDVFMYLNRRGMEVDCSCFLNTCSRDVVVTCFSTLGLDGSRRVYDTF